MRTIKFRGKRVDNGEWVYGVPYFLQITEEEPEDSVNKACIITGVDWDGTCGFMSPENRCFVEVHPETVGQFTGLLDKDGKEIYEDDFVSTDLQKPYNQVIYKNGCFMFECFDDNLYHDIFYPTSDIAKSEWLYGKVLGNIHDNPELL